MASLRSVMEVALPQHATHFENLFDESSSDMSTPRINNDDSIIDNLKEFY